MASHSIVKGDLGHHAVALTANTVETYTFSEDLDEVVVISHDGTAALYVTVDGRTPAVAGAATRILPAAIGTLSLDVPTAGSTVVKLISAGTPTVSVQRGR